VPKLEGDINFALKTLIFLVIHLALRVFGVAEQVRASGFRRSQGKIEISGREEAR